ncbi:MAG: Rab family GTPase [Candidatus Hodarchaeota archaeon]
MPVILVGNKTDLPTAPIIQDELQNFLKIAKVVGFYEISAKYGTKEQVEEIFCELTQQMFKDTSNS